MVFPAARRRSVMTQLAAGTILQFSLSCEPLFSLISLTMPSLERRDMKTTDQNLDLGMVPNKSPRMKERCRERYRNSVEDPHYCSTTQSPFASTPGRPIPSAPRTFRRRTPFAALQSFNNHCVRFAKGHHSGSRYLAASWAPQNSRAGTMGALLPPF